MTVDNDKSLPEALSNQPIDKCSNDPAYSIYTDKKSPVWVAIS